MVSIGPPLCNMYALMPSKIPAKSKWTADQKRFMAKTKRLKNGCLKWTAFIHRKGYGTFKMNGQPWLAHRLAYKWWVGRLRKGLVVDHLCRNRACVEPAHLEQVTSRANTQRGNPGKPRKRHRRCKSHRYVQIPDKAQSKGWRWRCLGCVKARATEHKRRYARLRTRYAKEKAS